jgi:hypothetical protein
MDVNGVTDNHERRSPWVVTLGVSPFPADFTFQVKKYK